MIDVEVNNDRDGPDGVAAVGGDCPAAAKRHLAFGRSALHPISPRACPQSPFREVLLGTGLDHRVGFAEAHPLQALDFALGDDLHRHVGHCRTQVTVAGTVAHSTFRETEPGRGGGEGTVAKGELPGVPARHDGG